MKNLKNALNKPGTESQPWALWIWNFKISKDEMVNQFQSLIDHGFGGVSIRPGRDMSPAYLSEEFFELFETVLQIAKSRGIKIRIADDFSYSWNHIFNLSINQIKKYRAQQLILEKIVTPSESSDTTIQLVNQESSIVIAAKMSDHQISLADLKVLPIKSEKETIIWKPQPGDWKIFIFRKEYVKAQSEGYLPNVFNGECVQKYISTVLDLFKSHLSQYCPDTLCGFINEMPVLRPGDNAIPWDDDLPAKYKTRYKKDIIKLLPVFFTENCVQGRTIRQHWYSFLLESMKEQYIEPLESWAKKNQWSHWVLYADRNLTKTKNELVGSFLNIPVCKAEGLQNLDGVQENCALLKMFSDSRSLDGKHELITILGRNRSGYAATVQGLKNEFDYSLMCGQSKILIDGFFFNIDQRNGFKDALSPAWYSPESEQMKKLCLYISRSNELRKNVKWIPSVAVLSPESEILSEYFPNNNESAKKIFSLYQKVVAALDNQAIMYDVISEEFLVSCTVHDKGDFSGNASSRKSGYNTLIIPHAKSISKGVFSFIEKAVQKGIKVIFIDELPKNISDENVSQSVVTRFNKLLDPKKNYLTVIKNDVIEDALRSLQDRAPMASYGGGDGVFVKYGSGDNYDLYIIYNSSETKDKQIQLSVPQQKYFGFVDCEKGELFEINDIQAESGKSILTIDIPSKSTFYIIGTAAKISSQNYSKHSQAAVNHFCMPHRSYRVVMKDQWSFETNSLNALPLANWNVRIGFSRESGGISHFYESNFQTKILPSKCYFVLNDLTFAQSHHHSNDQGIELFVNGLKADLIENSEYRVNEIPKKDSTVSEVLPEDCFVRLIRNQRFGYSISNLLLQGNNRISMRTTGRAMAPQSMYFPPLILGNFTITKGQSGWVIDKPENIIGYGSWAKYGYPYLSGKGIYRQSFEIPNEFDKIILRFSQISGSIEIKINEKNLGIFNWQPIEIDITSICEKNKRNDLTIGVLNTVDNIVRMNGRPSGLIGEVYLDVY